MFSIIKERTPYFIYFGMFVWLGLFYHKTLPEEWAIEFFSDHRTHMRDLFFTTFTNLGDFVPYVLATIFFYFRRREYVYMPLVAGVSVGLLAYSIKDYFGHPRPMLFFKNAGTFDTLNLVPHVELLTGMNSFPSGHSMSAFTLYSLLCFTVGSNVLWQLFFFLVAVTVGISRVYLVEHFPQDVLFGAVLGVVLAMIIYYIYSLFIVKHRIV